jgi:hypothetical protein
MSPRGHQSVQRCRFRGRPGWQRGEAAEAKALMALRHPRRPWWFLSVRQATEREDLSGIDLVVETADRGRLYLQVKSSKGAASAWKNEHRRDPRPIAVIVVRPDDDLNTVYGAALGKLILLRERSTLG